MKTAVEVPSPICLRAFSVLVARKGDWHTWAYFLRTQVKFEEIQS